MEVFCKQSQTFLTDDERLQGNERRTFVVVLVTSTMMVGEIIAGYLTGSMALLADGWHMASHATALIIAFLAYRLARHPKMNQKFSFGAGKIIPLGGYTSAIVLTMIAFLMIGESVTRLLHPRPITYNDAIAVAILGLVVNVVSALILNGGGHSHAGHSHDSHHDHEHEHEHEHHEDHAHEDHGQVHDLNLRSAIIHVVADAFTSVLAIGALLTAKYAHYDWLDPTMGIVGSFVIMSWAFQLCRQTGWELLDGHSMVVDAAKVRALLQTVAAELIDFHAWRVAPRAVACEIVVSSPAPKGAHFYHELLKTEFAIQHLVVEEVSASKTF